MNPAEEIAQAIEQDAAEFITPDLREAAANWERWREQQASPVVSAAEGAAARAIEGGSADQRVEAAFEKAGMGEVQEKLPHPESAVHGLPGAGRIH